MKIFLDSDVIISSLISKKGAAYFIVNSSKNIKIISNYSTEEMTRVAKRGKIDEEKLSNLVKERLEIVKSDKSLKNIKKEYKKYIKDENDAHIVAGANQSKAKILLTYNTKHFLKENIKKDLNISIMTPGKFLQYLRSQEKA